MMLFKKWKKNKNSNGTTAKNRKELEKDELKKINGGCQKPVKHDLVLDVVEQNRIEQSKEWPLG